MRSANRPTPGNPVVLFFSGCRSRLDRGYREINECFQLVIDVYQLLAGRGFLPDTGQSQCPHRGLCSDILLG